MVTYERRERRGDAELPSKVRFAFEPSASQLSSIRRTPRSSLAHALQFRRLSQNPTTFVRNSALASGDVRLEVLGETFKVSNSQSIATGSSPS